ncbi:MAG: HU family DNA-binding protein [Verrucomicrobia bacterium]|nr:HU family DNA-binding protein [Verrucomicrobiota bacterium]MDA1086378.1 HU family DNA-binding protein [Verrucomicrobiota bacterium]
MGGLNNKKSITRKNLARELAARTGKTADEAKRFLEELANIAYDEANSEKGFTIPGLCKIQVVFRKARRGRNPRTGEPILIGARKALKVSAVQKAKDTVTPRPKGLVTSLKITPIPIPDVRSTRLQPQEEDFASFVCPHCDAEVEALQGVSDVIVQCPGCIKDMTIPARASAQDVAAMGDVRFSSFNCQHCGQDIEAAKQLVGAEISCPACSEVIRVPSREESSTAADPSPDDAPNRAKKIAGETMRIELPQEVLDSMVRPQTRSDGKRIAFNRT